MATPSLQAVHLACMVTAFLCAPLLRYRAGSLDHLLVSERKAGEFLGRCACCCLLCQLLWCLPCLCQLACSAWPCRIQADIALSLWMRPSLLHHPACPCPCSLAMLDPRFFQGRWKATAVAKTHVVVLHMTREGLERFLQQNPLAQVRGCGGAGNATVAWGRQAVFGRETCQGVKVGHASRVLAQMVHASRRRSPAGSPPTPGAPARIHGAGTGGDCQAGGA